MAKQAVKEVKKSGFEVSVTVNGQEVRGNGENLLALFQTLALPSIIKTNVGVLVKTASVERERILTRMQAKKVFTGGNPLKFFVYSLEKLLK